jgi:hypothetical protein
MTLEGKRGKRIESLEPRSIYSSEEKTNFTENEVTEAHKEFLFLIEFRLINVQLK